MVQSAVVLCAPLFFPLSLFFLPFPCLTDPHTLNHFPGAGAAVAPWTALAAQVAANTATLAGLAGVPATLAGLAGVPAALAALAGVPAALTGLQQQMVGLQQQMAGLQQQVAVVQNFEVRARNSKARGLQPLRELARDVPAAPGPLHAFAVGERNPGYIAM